MAFSFIRLSFRLTNSSANIFRNGFCMNMTNEQVPILACLQNFYVAKSVHQNANCCVHFMESGSVVNQRQYSSHVSRPSSRQENHKIDFQSDSDSDSDSDTTKRGESEFWRRKMRTFHGILDINKDGVISYDDFKLLIDKFVNLGHLSSQHEEEFRKLIKNMWEERWGSIDPYNLVTTEQYLEDMHHVMNDKSLRKKVHHFLPYLFKAVDKNKDGMISIDEYKLFFQCLNLPSEAAVMSFYAIDENNDGNLSMKEFVTLGRDFFLSEDSRKPSKLFWGPLID